ncbi:hypothetical protein PTSG_00603 [Salpingoeca rosetta]|uniref:Uncharacterized protein n=1 Tax=Salpingoeca rosetta (strain ATCC 50818 / BSB-021) TaxID=946362 RepID=F2TWY4_SALR5|nr:uncharacterized protein PTSG_00603 [Salpingoeca rosetta]EGD75893.1 hypothetical protein PTSG_00603 [Salpingoeca rosetta]|eukprot:XP_004998069.1 hypothetical protein PTSG_00603 [Salpingoeca rosetta]
MDADDSGGCCGVFVGAGECAVVVGAGKAGAVGHGGDSSGGRRIHVVYEAATDVVQAVPAPRRHHIPVKPGEVVLQLTSPSPRQLLVVTTPKDKTTHKKAAVIIVRRYKLSATGVHELIHSYECAAAAATSLKVRAIGHGYAALDDCTLLGPQQALHLDASVKKVAAASPALAHFAVPSRHPTAPLVLCSTAADEWALLDVVAGDHVASVIPRDYAAHTLQVVCSLSPPRLCLLTTLSQAVLLSPQGVIRVISLAQPPGSLYCASTTFIHQSTQEGLTCFSASTGTTLIPSDTIPSGRILCTGHTANLEAGVCLYSRGSMQPMLLPLSALLQCAAAPVSADGESPPSQFHDAIARKLAVDQDTLSRTRTLNARKQQLLAQAFDTSLCSSLSADAAPARAFVRTAARRTDTRPQRRQQQWQEAQLVTCNDGDVVSERTKQGTWRVGGGGQRVHGDERPDLLHKTRTTQARSVIQVCKELKHGRVRGSALIKLLRVAQEAKAQVKEQH